MNEQRESGNAADYPALDRLDYQFLDECTHVENIVWTSSKNKAGDFFCKRDSLYPIYYKYASQPGLADDNAGLHCFSFE